jgi:TRAP-type C4-dicarboxylate transport system permease large subunit
LTAVTRFAFPFLLIMAVAVLLITYVPWISLGILEALGK